MARILVVEDDDTLTEELEHALRHLGYEVAGKAATGEACLALMRTAVPICY
jgi:DNA-binding response OmpR family regulator